MKRCRQLCGRLLAILATRMAKELSASAVIEASIRCDANKELTDVIEALDKFFMKCTDGHVPPEHDKALH